MNNKPELIPVQENDRALFNTSSGTVIDLKNPDKNYYDIRDVAHALSHICRFGGHTKAFYSVAQHSVFVMHLIRPALYLLDEEQKKTYLMHGLLHDMTEAYVGDVIKPLKNLLPQYELIEDSFFVQMCKAFGLEAAYMSNDLTDCIKHHDRIALDLEHEALIKGDPTRMMKVMRQVDMLEENEPGFWPPAKAKAAFLHAYDTLKGYAPKPAVK